jgi:hypothetical protein
MNGESIVEMNIQPSDPVTKGGNASPRRKLAMSPLHAKIRSPCTKNRQQEQILKGKRILERYRKSQDILVVCTVRLDGQLANTFARVQATAKRNYFKPA